MNERKQRVVISRVEFLKVTRWLDENWKMLEQEKFSSDQLAEKINFTLKLEVPLHRDSLRRIVRDMGRDVREIFKAGGSSIGKNRGNMTRIMATQIALTQKVLINVCQSLGIKAEEIDKMMPDWLAKYAGGKTNCDSVPNPAQPKK